MRVHSNCNSGDEDIKKQQRRLDAKAKILLSHKDVIANILRYTVKEFQGYSVQEVVACLNGQPEVGTEEVDDNLAPRIDAAGSEAVSAKDGIRTYDIKFRTTIPGTDEEATLIINVESQYKYDPGYTLEKRGIYYLSRMISSQYGVEFQKSDFDNIKKVYSIWVCIESPPEVSNTITLYKFRPENIVGSVPDRTERYDLMSLVMICLGNVPDDSKGLIKMLDVLLKKFATDGKPITKDFEKEYNLDLSDIYGEVDDMCNIGEGIYNKGIAVGEARGEARGRAEGRAEGKAEERQNLTANLREMGMTEEQIKQALKQRN